MSIQLVRKTMGAQELLPEVQDVVMERTQGVPLYCVEFARVLKESGGKVRALPTRLL